MLLKSASSRKCLMSSATVCQVVCSANFLEGSLLSGPVYVWKLAWSPHFRWLSRECVPLCISHPYKETSATCWLTSLPANISTVFPQKRRTSRMASLHLFDPDINITVREEKLQCVNSLLWASAPTHFIHGSDSPSPSAWLPLQLAPPAAKPSCLGFLC